MGADPTPELVAALERIGWKGALALHPSLILPLLDLRPTPSELFATKREATEVVKEVDALWNHLRAAYQALQALSPELKQASFGATDRLLAAFRSETEGMESLADTVAREACALNVQRRGPAPNAAALRIAVGLTEVYFLAHGKMPPMGRDAVTGAPTGKFVPAVAEVLSLVGLKISDPVRLCEKAKAAITDQRIAQLSEKRAARGRLGLPLRHMDN